VGFDVRRRGQRTVVVRIAAIGAGLTYLLGFVGLVLAAAIWIYHAGVVTRKTVSTWSPESG
jgi:hypothetical protein